MSLTKIGSIGINTGIQFAGVTTITTLNASDNVLSVGGTVNFVSDVSIGGTVSIAGTLTYEDVTNVDAVGLITARNGIVVGSGITLSKDGDVFFTGIATGNGSGLTALNASNLGSGTVPTARLGSGTASSSTFLRGDSTFAAVTSTTINNNADNRLITGSGTANTLEAESTLTYDGTNLDLGDDKKIRIGASQDLQIFHDAGAGSNIRCTGTKLEIRSDSLILQASNAEKYFTGTANGAVELYHDNSKKFETASGGVSVTGSATVSGDVSIADKIIHTGDTNTAIRFPAADTFTVETAGSERIRIDSDGRVMIGQTSSVVPFMVTATASNFGGMVMTGVLGDATSYASGVGGGLTLSGKYNSGGSQVGFAAIRGLKENGTDGNYNGALTLNTRPNGGNMTERARIDSSGTLFLGTTSYGGGGNDPIVYVRTASANAVKIHKTGSGASTLQLTCEAGTDGSEEGLSLIHI